MDPLLNNQMSEDAKQEVIAELSIDITKKFVILVLLSATAFLIGEDIGKSVKGIQRMKLLGTK